MPGFDGNGNYTRHYSWQAREAANVGIVSDEHDTEDDEFARGFNQTFLRDGQAAATGNWDLANHKIANLNAGTADGDAVNMGQLTGSGPSGTPDFKKSINLIGADLNGRLNFRSATGVNGIGWFGADLSWVAKLDEANKTRDRLVLNNKFDATGTDVAVLDDEGNLGVTTLTYNLSHDTAGQWRAIAPGFVGRLQWTANGGLELYNVATATVTDPYVNVTTLLKKRLGIVTDNGDVTIDLNKETATDYASISGSKGGLMRWQMQFGTAHAESGSNAGSNFYLSRYNDAGAVIDTPFYINRVDGKVGMPLGITGLVQLDSYINSSTLAIFGGIGGAYLRPNGYANSAGQFWVDTSGYIHPYGIYERSGTAGSFGTQVYNSLYNASNDLRWYVGTGTGGPVGYYTPACDYRIKRDVRPLPSSWEAVKKLRPVMFKPKAFGDVFKDEDVDRAGFLAHELQDALGPWAATGTKDAMEDVVEEAEDGTRKVVGTRPVVQGPDVMAVVASLCSALQEAQLRIEALEARLAA